MAKKPSYSNYLLKTQKQRSRYFWCKRIVALFGAGYAGQLAKPYVGNGDMYIIALIIAFFVGRVDVSGIDIKKMANS